MTKKFNVAIVGASGLVGGTVLSILEERKFPVDKLFLLASARSAGEERNFRGQDYRIEDIAKFDFSQTRLCFFCVSNAVAAEYAPRAAALGNIVIDKSSHFRYDPEVPLVIPEVNKEALAGFTKKNIIANPNCSATPIVLALKPIHDAVGLARVNVATYQSVSGTGKDAVNELAEQATHLLNGKAIKAKVYAQQIAFNLIPQIDDFAENGFTREEMKIILETQKILNAPIAINPTAVRVPVFFGHSAAVHIETVKPISVKKVEELLQKMPGIKLCTGKFPYATPTQEVAGTDEVFVGRIRADLHNEKGLNLWVATDNIRKGAALNAIQIAEHLVADYLS